VRQALPGALVILLIIYGSPLVRSKVMEGVQELGLVMDQDTDRQVRNTARDPVADVTHPNSKV